MISFIVIAQYIGCTVVRGLELLPGEGERLAHSLLRTAPRSNKRRVTITLTPESVYISDMIHRVGDGS